MSGFYITRLRLEASDFPGQLQLFTALKRPVYFRNVALEYIQRGGWAELPQGHYEAFAKALKEGWVRGERQWHVDYTNFVVKWRAPIWIEDELLTYGTGVETARLATYIRRCKDLLAGGIIRPLANNPGSIPPQIIKYIVDCLEKEPIEGHSPEFYSMISSNLETHPNKEIAHRTFSMLQKKVETNYRFSQVDILDGLSRMNPEDRKTFMSWLYKSPKHLEQIKDSNYSVSDIIMKSVMSGEIWYEAKSNEDKGTVPATPRPQESSTEVFSTSKQV